MSVLRVEVLQHIQNYPPHFFWPQEEDLQDGEQAGRDSDPLPLRPGRLPLCSKPAGRQVRQPGGNIPPVGTLTPGGGGARQHAAHGGGAPHVLPLLRPRPRQHHLLGTPTGAHGQ